MTRPTVKSILGDIGTSTSVLTRRPTVKQVLGETSVATQEKQTGFFQSMAQGIVKPFARGTANLASSLSSTFNLGQALIDKSKGNKEGYVNNMKQAAQKIEVDLGSYLGKYGPVGAGEKLSTQLKQGFGMGLEIGSWFIAGGGAKNLLKELGKAGLSKTTKQVLTKEIVKLGAKEGAKIGASAGGFGAGGAALAEKESTAGDVLKAGAIGATAGGVLGAGIGALGGKLSAKFARPKPIQPTAKPVVGATPVAPKGVSKAISSDLAPLAQEARKFKSADEFVKAQPKVFHGTTRDFDVFDIGKLGEATGSKSGRHGFWFTDDISTAKSYSKAENEKIVGNLLEQGKRKEALVLEDKIFANKDSRFLKEVSLDLKNPKIINAKGKTYNDLNEVLTGDDTIQSIITKAKAEGRDGLIINNLSDHADFSVYKPATHYLVFDAKNIKTKSQLTDIYNKANKN